ncbi:hypothetical protein I7I50_01514 [Histoplasma capsulatum G186AR]|uniref:Uncharacterized protein n=1 Tax=Ajellomyces capsulatus TaxID=5037 RepID=A0A8H7YAR3_AJECA|nr:hypothetical protein I7I52_12630 [Histoplasma capsulatum]QSS73375.1 hypothetical protein I7I50_01514 [Histoplasma capsulatum G186AR]
MAAWLALARVSGSPTESQNRKRDDQGLLWWYIHNAQYVHCTWHLESEIVIFIFFFRHSPKTAIRAVP